MIILIINGKRTTITRMVAEYWGFADIIPKVVYIEKELNKSLIGIYLILEILNELIGSKNVMPFKISSDENILHNEINELKLMMQIYFENSFIKLRL